MELVRVTEAAGLAATRWTPPGDKPGVRLVIQPSGAQLPHWAEPLRRQIAGVEYIGRELVVAALYVAALVLLVWFVVGLIAGFLSSQALMTGLLGVGGAGTAGELLRRFWGKARRKPYDDTLDQP